MRSRRIIAIFFAALGIAVAAPAVSPTAVAPLLSSVPIASALTPDNAEAYLHVSVAQGEAVSFVRYDVCDGWSCERVWAKSYSRYSDSRIDVNVAVDRTSGRHCERRVIVRGSDDFNSVGYDSTGVGWTCWG